jgi:hypothetical protein
MDGHCVNPRTIVRARGLPWQVSDLDVALFFAGLDIEMFGQKTLGGNLKYFPHSFVVGELPFALGPREGATGNAWSVSKGPSTGTGHWNAIDGI